MARVDKCYTEKQYAYRLWSIVWWIYIPFILVILYFGNEIYNTYDVKERICLTFTDALLFSIPFLFIQIYFFVLWFPDHCKRKKALKYGKEYKAEIVRINYQKHGKYLALRTSYYFVLTIEYDKFDKKERFKTGIYIGTHNHYIPAERKCFVYEYKGKPYVQDFMYIEKNIFQDKS